MTKYIRTARNIGESMNEQGKTVYVIGNALFQYELTKLEYLMWKQISHFPSIEEWYAVMTEKTKKSKSLIVDAFLNQFQQMKIVAKWEFADLDDPALLHINVIRNGLSHGYVNGEYFTSSYDVKKKTPLPKESFYVWRSATGYVTLLEAISRISFDLGVSEQQALDLLMKHGYEFIQLGLWNVEVLDLEDMEGEQWEK